MQDTKVSYPTVESLLRTSLYQCQVTTGDKPGPMQLGFQEYYVYKMVSCCEISSME